MLHPSEQATGRFHTETLMISRRMVILNILVVGGILAAPLPASSETKRTDPSQGLDTDRDGRRRRRPQPCSIDSTLITMELSTDRKWEADCAQGS